MKPYLDLVRMVLEQGEERRDRTGTGTLGVFGVQTRYDLREGFPLVTTKKILFDAVVRELLWFLRGSTNIHDGLAAHTPIWNAWADEHGELGPIYGFQWRNWGGETAGDGLGIDQIRGAIELIRRDPFSRRILVSAWNVADVPRMRLPPCHLLFQFHVSGLGTSRDPATGKGSPTGATAPRGRLDLQLYQRSADLALGVPFNIASYALLLTMVAQECGLEPGVFVHTLGDAHVYLNHVDGLREQLTREPYPLPRVELAERPFDELTFEDVKLVGYQHHPFIKFPVAV
ncbi:MAG: thymidylate synthase [Deltaproteobacteria bacterium]|nr:thymidylate synthase [Deltaproteobacteria bacterium]